VRNAKSNDAGFSRACTGKDQDRTIDDLGGLSLLRIELIEKQNNSRLPVLISLAREGMVGFAYDRLWNSRWGFSRGATVGIICLIAKARNKPLPSNSPSSKMSARPRYPDSFAFRLACSDSLNACSRFSTSVRSIPGE